MVSEFLVITAIWFKNIEQNANKVTSTSIIAPFSAWTNILGTVYRTNVNSCYTIEKINKNNLLIHDVIPIPYSRIFFILIKFKELLSDSP